MTFKVMRQDEIDKCDHLKKGARIEPGATLALSGWEVEEYQQKRLRRSSQREQRKADDGKTR